MIRASSVASTSVDFPRLRLRFALFELNRWRADALRRSTRPVPVILNRFATDFFVLLRAIGFGMGWGI